jgi:hypothetical protein
LLDKASLGIFSGAWAPAAPLTQATRAPARILAHRALHASRLQTDFNSKNENICSPTTAVPIGAFTCVPLAPASRLAIDCWKVRHPSSRVERLRPLSSYSTNFFLPPRDRKIPTRAIKLQFLHLQLYAGRIAAMGQGLPSAGRWHHDRSTSDRLTTDGYGTIGVSRTILDCRSE